MTANAARRRRHVSLSVILASAIAVVPFAGCGTFGSSKHPASKATKTSGRQPTVQKFELQPAGWTLATPLSRAVVLVDDGRLVILGGLAPHNATTPAITEVDPQSGAVVDRGTLVEPVHDAAGAVLGARLMVLGGGAAKVSATVQGVTPEAQGPNAQRLGMLPAPRADLAAVTIGNQVVVAGGYDGNHGLADVLSTADGSSFTTVAPLPEPVRYPSAVAVGNKLYVIGGEGAKGDVADIQVVDMQTRQASIAAHLSHTVSHAAAAVLGGKVYLFGGRVTGHASDLVEEIDLATGADQQVARLPVAITDAAVAMLGETAFVVGGEGEHGQPVDSVEVARLVDTAAAAPASGANGRSGASAPFTGNLLIADRGNNRLLVVDAAKNVHWTFPSASSPAPADGFYFPDDAFFAKRGTAIITNEEEQDTIIEIAYPSGHVISTYGHPRQPGSGPGFLNQPDDAYLLADGRVTVADAKNCRVLFLEPDFTFQSAIGSTGRCRHDIPRDVAYPNGDTPLANGNLLISEINGSFVDEVTPQGVVVWSQHLPLAYPSDPQQIGPDLYLIADYAKPGGIYEFTREGRVTWSYSAPDGEGMLDHPSLVEQLPSGLLCVNDDYRHRVVIIDPVTKSIVWQYGQTDVAGTGPGQLNTPDGFDLLTADGTTPTHPHTG
jgi:hypothetical protein